MEKINTTLWEDYRSALSYRSSIGLSEKLPEYVDFYEGRQWPAVTERTRNMPRPVINIIKMICRNKKSAILKSPIRLHFSSDDEGFDMSRLNSFADYIQREIGQSELDRRGVLSAAVKGSYFYHYYWDSDARGMKSSHGGALRCELIDPLNIFFSNPRECDEQKQKWIIISSREDVDSLRSRCDSDADKNLIVPDEYDNKYGTPEQPGGHLCTVLTRYFRRNSLVFCEKATKTIIINKAFPITPDLPAAKAALSEGIDAPNNSLFDEPKKISYPCGCTLYPIVSGSYEYREGSIYGLGEVEGLIPNQKAINFNLGMLLLNAQETAWGKYIVLPDALRGQQISNEPGQILTDWSKTGSGIRKMTEQGMQSQPLALIDTVTQLTRTVTGATEVMSGESLGSGLSGVAIAQLQSQAQRPIEDLRNSFRFVKEKQGRVLAQFFRYYYYAAEFTYEKPQGQSGEKRVIHSFFNSGDYRDCDMTVTVETSSGSSASTAGDISAIETLFSKGAISLETFIKAYPDDAISNKEELLRLIGEEKASENSLLKKEIEALGEKLAQMKNEQELNRRSTENVENIISENIRLKKTIAELYMPLVGNNDKSQ